MEMLLHLEMQWEGSLNLLRAKERGDRLDGQRYGHKKKEKQGGRSTKLYILLILGFYLTHRLKIFISKNTDNVIYIFL